MNTAIPRIVRTIFYTVAAAVALLAPSALVAGGADQPSPAAQPCYNGVLPWNPYLQSCSLPAAGQHIPGAAPGPVAIIACRNHPGCLSWYVNNP